MKRHEVLQMLLNHTGKEEELILFDIKINEKIVDTPIGKVNIFETKTIEYNPKSRCLLDYDDTYLHLMYELGHEKIKFEKVHKIRFE